MSVFEQIAKWRVIPVITIEDEEKAILLADVLIAGGLPVAEITFRTPAAAAVIRRIRTERPNMLIGAGTVLTQENLLAAKEAGAVFGVAPGLNPKMLDVAKKASFPFIPGVCTPTEVEIALSCDYKVLKFFPATAAGGIDMLRSLITPYKHTGVQFMPTGGIKPVNLVDFLKLSNVIACGGTWIATKDDIDENRWSAITYRCKEALEIISIPKSVWTAALPAP